jgi:hypothetical protein
VQVKAFVNQVEQSAKYQLQSKPSWMTASTASPTSNNNNKNIEIKYMSNKEEKAVAEVMDNPKVMVLAASRKPSGAGLDQAPTPPPKKPSFYFGQPMSDLVRSTASAEARQTAIDKVKKNESLTHPKRAQEAQELKVSELSHKGRHMSIITVSEETPSSKPKVASSLSSGVSSLSSSSNSSTRSSPAKDSSHESSMMAPPAPAPVQVAPPPPKRAPPAPKMAPTLPKKSAETPQDDIRKAFEAQLLAGKNRLKKATAVEADVGQVAKRPPAPVPPPMTSNSSSSSSTTRSSSIPPPPPPPTRAALNGAKQSLKSYEIPQAPMLKKTTPRLASKKGFVAPNGISTRDELMNAIRGTGGITGLRKVIKNRRCPKSQQVQSVECSNVAPRERTGQ